MKRYTTAELRQAVREGARISRARWEDARLYDAELAKAKADRYAPIELDDSEFDLVVVPISDWNP